MKLLPCGQRALLVELDDLQQVLDWTAAIEGANLDVADVVPAARTVLVTVRRPSELAAVRRALTDLTPARSSRRQDAPVVTIPTVYDGPDLADVARWTSLTLDEVVAAHSGRDWIVGFTGFAPGFAYLTDGDPRLAVPRRRQPRPQVPAGAVALAGAYSGVYPRASPGGWQLIGRTDVVLFDLDRDPPALLAPGTRVRFVEVGR